MIFPKTDELLNDWRCWAEIPNTVLHHTLPVQLQTSQIFIEISCCQKICQERIPKTFAHSYQYWKSSFSGKTITLLTLRWSLWCHLQRTFNNEEIVSRQALESAFTQVYCLQFSLK